MRGATEQLEGVTQINVFQPTLPLRGATRTSWSQCAPLCFNPRSPCGERRRSSPDRSASARFNPRSPCGERRSSDHGSFPVGRGFNPRSPCGERLLEMTLSPLAVPFQPTLPLRGATGLWLWWHVGNRVSTHAPLAGSDGYGRTSCRESPCFNPRSPCGERRRHHRTMSRWCGFQPTLPLRGATAADPRGAPLGVVSTHAPLAGSDGHAREAQDHEAVSTHAPLAGSDSPPASWPPSSSRFNPRSPCGERPRRGRRRRTGSRFNPRSPCGERRGGATENSQHTVSTHAPLAGSDSPSSPSRASSSCFNPRSPCGERPGGQLLLRP